MAAAGICCSKFSVAMMIVGSLATFLMCGGTHLALLACWVAIATEVEVAM